MHLLYRYILIVKLIAKFAGRVTLGFIDLISFTVRIREGFIPPVKFMFYRQNKNGNYFADEI